MIDVLIIGAAMVALTLLAIGVALGTGEGRDLAMQTVAIVWLSGAFVLRNFYFIGFELRPGAATPGKRMHGPAGDRPRRRAADRRRRVRPQRHARAGGVPAA